MYKDKCLWNLVQKNLTSNNFLLNFLEFFTNLFQDLLQNTRSQDRWSGMARLQRITQVKKVKKHLGTNNSCTHAFIKLAYGESRL